MVSSVGYQEHEQPKGKEKRQTDFIEIKNLYGRDTKKKMKRDPQSGRKCSQIVSDEGLPQCTKNTDNSTIKRKLIQF